MTEETNDKKCPYCAEIIKQEAIKCRYCGEVLTEDKLPSNSEASPTVASCSNCNVQLVTKEVKKSGVSGSEILGVLMLLIGLFLLFISPLFGILFIVLGLIGSLSSKGKKTIMVCPECGAQGRTI